MSRTYRRKGGNPSGKLWHVSEYKRIGQSWRFERIYFQVGSSEYNAGLARYRSDAGTENFKEPGPSWFRNMFSERPQRRLNNKELRKFMLDENYEPMVVEKDKLPYWI